MCYLLLSYNIEFHLIIQIEHNNRISQIDRILFAQYSEYVLK